jgi:hypothetical protein
LLDLYCVENKIYNLDLTANDKLKTLRCSKNLITCIKVSNLAETEKMQTKEIPDGAKFSLECE